MEGKDSKLSLLISVASLVVAALSLIASTIISCTSLYYSHEANATSRLTLERASGKVLPAIGVTYRQPHVSLTSFDEVQQEQIVLEIRNEGHEPVDALRFEVSTFVAWSQNKGYNFLDQFQRADHELRGTLSPGGLVRVDLKKDVLTQLMKLDIPVTPNDAFWTACQINCTARIVGQQSFAVAGSDRTGHTNSIPSFGITWRPSVFRTREFQSLFAKYRPVHEMFNK